MDQETSKKKPLLSPTLQLFMLAMILANIAGNMYGPLLPLYLKSLGASVVQIGLFFTIAQIIPLILQILGGWISDSLGRLKSIAFGSVAGILSYVGLILAPTWQWVFAGEGFGAITRSLVGPSFGAFIAEASAEENRARVYGITESIFTVVSIVGPPLGGFLVDKYGFKVMFICAAIIYTCATLIRVSMARRSVSYESQESNGSLNLKSLRVNLGAMFGLIMAGGLVTWVLVTDGIRDISFSFSNSLLPVYLEEEGGLNAQRIGWLSSIMGIANMLINIPAGWLADKKGERLVIILGFLFQAGALFLFMNVNSFWGFAIVGAAFGIGIGLMTPAYQSLISKALPAKLRGTGFGLIHSSLGVFSLPAPAIGASLYQNYSPKMPFMITAWASLLAIIPVWAKFKITKRDEAANEVALARLDASEDQTDLHA
jgi:MFS family permease